MFCNYGPYSWEVEDVENFRLNNVETSKILSDTVKLLIYFVIRHVELCLFRHLQDLANALPKDDVEKHHTYIMFLLLTLLAGKPFNRTMAQSFDIVS